MLKHGAIPLCFYFGARGDSSSLVAHQILSLASAGFATLA